MGTILVLAILMAVVAAIILNLVKKTRNRENPRADATAAAVRCQEAATLQNT